jgi:hypothetical protein
MAILTSLKEAYRFVLSTDSIYNAELANGFNAAVVQLGTACVSLVTAVLILWYYLVVALLKLSVMVFPHMIATGKAVVEFHRTKLSFTDVCVEVVAVVAVVAFLYFKRRLLAQWRVFEKYVAKKSKAAAMAAPHVAFFTLALVTSVVGRKFLVHVASESMLPVVTLLLPMYTTARDLYTAAGAGAGAGAGATYDGLATSDSDAHLSDSGGAGASKRRASLTPIKPPRREVAWNQKLTLWVVLAAYHTLATCFSLVPFHGRIASLLPSARELAVVVILWAQLSSQFTDIVFDAAKPLLRALASRIPAAKFGASSGASVASVLRMMKVITPAQETFLKALAQDSFLVLLACPFIFMPWRFAYAGVVIVALLFPAFRSANIVMGLEHGGAAKHGAVGSRVSVGSAAVDEVALGETQRWLEYWICLGAMWAARCYGFRMWPSVMMLTALWLQHSWFRGASSILQSLEGQWLALVDRHHRVRRQRDDGAKGSPGAAGRRTLALHVRTSGDAEEEDEEEELRRLQSRDTQDSGHGGRDERTARTPTPVLLRRQSRQGPSQPSSAGSRASSSSGDPPPGSGQSKGLGSDGDRSEDADGEGERDRDVDGERRSKRTSRGRDAETGGRKKDT